MAMIPADPDRIEPSIVEYVEDPLRTCIEKRQVEYPAFQEQLDLLYHDMAADKGTKAGEWFKLIKKVKDDNAKPE